MSCALTSGYALPCRDAVGGIEKIYVTELANANITVAANGTITDMYLDTGKRFWVYELAEESSEFGEKFVTSRENGTVYYEQSLSFTIAKLQASTRNELKLMVQNRLLVIVKDRNGKYWLQGETNGLMVDSADNTSGKAMGDFNGYKLTLSGKETAPMQEVSSATIPQLIIASVY